MTGLDSYRGSDLEQEFELDVGDEELESSYLSERDSEIDFEADAFEDIERELSIGESLAERLAGLASREYESADELDEALREAIDEHADHFLGKAFRKLGKFGKRAAMAGLKGAGLNPNMLKKLLSTDMLKKALATAAKAAMASNPALAGLAPALGPALKSLGMSEAEFEEPDEEAWRSFETMAEGAYEYMVSNLSDRAAEPLAAMGLAARSLKHGAERARSGAARRRGGARPGRELRVPADGLRPGDKIVIRIV